MNIFNAENRNFRINVVGFSIVGISYYLFSLLQNPDHLKANPLYTHGAYGIIISVIGSSITYYLFRYGRIPIIRIVILSAFLFGIWVVGVMYIGTSLKGSDNYLASVSWVGLLTIMYFMFVGCINGLLGFWITLFNIYVAIHAIFIGESSDPLVWFSIMNFAGIDNTLFVWFVVVLSALLGISEKGYEFITNQ